MHILGQGRSLQVSRNCWVPRQAWSLTSDVRFFVQVPSPQLFEQRVLCHSDHWQSTKELMKVRYPLTWSILLQYKDFTHTMINFKSEYSYLDMVHHCSSSLFQGSIHRKCRHVLLQLISPWSPPWYLLHNLRCIVLFPTVPTYNVRLHLMKTYSKLMKYVWLLRSINIIQDQEK